MLKRKSVDYDTETELNESSDNYNDLWDKIELSEKKECKNDSMEETKVKKPEACFVCGKKNASIEDFNHGIIVCRKCGDVESGIIDESPEWRQYNNEDGGNNSGVRCGGPINFFLPKSSMGTTIVGSVYSQIKKQHMWLSMPHDERSLNNVLTEIKNRCADAGIKKNVVDEAQLLYKHVRDCKYTSGKNKDKSIIFRGSNREDIKAACVYMACHSRGKPFSTKEIAKIFEIDIAGVTKGCKILHEMLKLGKDEGRVPEELTRISTKNAGDLIERHGKSLKLPQENTEVAIRIAKNIKRLGLAAEHTPPSIAAASILLMAKDSGLKLTKKEVSDEFNLSDVTITKPLKKITKYIKILKNDEATEELYKLMKKNS